MGMREALADVPLVDKGPWVTGFGANEHDWNLHDDDDEDDEGSGLPGRMLVRRAVQCFADGWGALDYETAARAFNLPLALVEDATAGLGDNFLGEPEEVVLDELSSLISVLIGTRGGNSSVALVARLTNQHPTRIIESVGSGYWLFLSGDRDDFEQLWIEAEGE